MRVIYRNYMIIRIKRMQIVKKDKIIKKFFSTIKRVRFILNNFMFYISII